MKHRLPLLFLFSTALAGCSTLSNRRDMYQPLQPSGPYSKALSDGTWRKGVPLTPEQRAKPSELTPPPPAPVLPVIPAEPPKLP